MTDTYHVYPTKDVKRHNTDGENCWCDPALEENLVIHNKQEINYHLSPPCKGRRKYTLRQTGKKQVKKFHTEVEAGLYLARIEWDTLYIHDETGRIERRLENEPK
jgi:hypothetical protein